MNTLVNIFLLVSLILSFTSCNQHKKINKFYQSGKIKATAIIINDSVLETTEYYPNGEIKWQGEYLYGFRNYHKDIISKNYAVQIFPNSDSLIAERKYYIRINVNNLHPNDLMIGVNNGTITLSDDENYDFKLTPEKQGVENICVYAKNDSGNVIKIFQKELQVSN